MYIVQCVRQHQYISNWEHNESIYWPEILLFHIIVPYLFSYIDFYYAFMHQMIFSLHLALGLVVDVDVDVSALVVYILYWNVS